MDDKTTKARPETKKENFNRESIKKEFEEKFKALESIDEKYPALIMARAAMRVFPFIASEGHFNFWVNKAAKAGPIDNRAKNITSIFFAARLAHRACFKTIEEKDLKAAAYADAYADAASAVSAASSAYASASAAYAADASASAVSAASAASSYAAYADAAYADAAYASADAYVEYYNGIIKDIAFSQNTPKLIDLANAPLWLSEIPEEVATFYNESFTPALKNLIDETSNVQTRAALQTILDEYDLIFKKNLKTATNRSAAETADITEDKLNREKLVAGLADILSHNANNQHQTIGLLGHWGAGKSSVLQLLKRALKTNRVKPPAFPESQQFLFGEFNAWAYENAKNIQAAMAHEVIRSLTRYQEESATQALSLLPRFVQYARNIFYRVMWQLLVRTRITLGFAIRKYPARLLLLCAWLVVLVGAVSVLNIQIEHLKDIGNTATWPGLLALLAALVRIPKDTRTLFSQPFTKEFLTYVNLPNYAQHIGEVAQMREDIALICDLRLRPNAHENTLGLGLPLREKRLLFVVDDLDRCGPEGIVKTFEAVRLILDIPHVTVVIAIDQRIALAALAKHYQELESFHALRDAKAIARDYLGKMIHYPIVLKELDFETSKGYMSSVWEETPEEFQQWLALLSEEQSLNEEEGEEANIEQPEKGEESGMTEAELVERVLALPKAAAKKEDDSPLSMSPEQKASFIGWANKFELNNPRQLKRLHNSYNLLRKVRDISDFNIGNKRPPDFGWLTAMLLLEFINNEVEESIRAQYCAYIQGNLKALTCKPAMKVVIDDALEVIDRAATRDTEIANASNRSPREALLEWVKLFVLPAIEGDVTIDNKPPV